MADSRTATPATTGETSTQQPRSSFSKDLTARLRTQTNLDIPSSRPYTAASSMTQVDHIPGVETPEIMQEPEVGTAGGSQEEAGAQEAGVPQTPQTSLTFLLVSGRRRTMGFEPETTIGRVKDLVWNAWPSGQFSFSLFDRSVKLILYGAGRMAG